MFFYYDDDAAVLHTQVDVHDSVTTTTPTNLVSSDEIIQCWFCQRPAYCSCALLPPLRSCTDQGKDLHPKLPKLSLSTLVVTPLPGSAAASCAIQEEEDGVYFYIIYNMLDAENNPDGDYIDAALKNNNTGYKDNDNKDVEAEDGYSAQNKQSRPDIEFSRMFGSIVAILSRKPAHKRLRGRAGKRTCRS